MRDWACFVFVGALAGCTGATINAGSNDGGGAGNPANLEGGGNGPTIIASLIQLTPTQMMSDETSLFWLSGDVDTGPVSSVPVGGGTISSVGPGNVGSGFLWVDDTYVYYQSNNGEIDRAPKTGAGASTPVVEAGDADSEVIGAATVFGNTLYWVDSFDDQTGVTTLFVKSMPLQGGSVSVVAQVSTSSLFQQPEAIGVTATTVFLGGLTTSLEYFPLNAAPSDGGIIGTQVDVRCVDLVSDTDAVYCASNYPTNSVLRIASDGTMTTLGTFLGGQGGSSDTIGFDDTYIYWVDSVTVGTIMRVPKTGGTATIIARDTSPVALAVDANAVYWSDVGGNIMKLAK